MASAYTKVAFTDSAKGITATKLNLLRDDLSTAISGAGGGGTGDMTKAVYDTNNNGKVDTCDSVPWTAITGTPSTFPPTPGPPQAHQASHVTGTDQIPSASTSVRGLMPQANGNPNAFYGSDGTQKQVSYPMLAGSQPGPVAHALSHLDNGTDVIPVVTATRTGLTPKLSGSATTFLNGTGTFSAPAGGGDMTKAVYDTNNNGVVDTAEAIPWTGVTGKPATFPPSAHAATHNLGGSDAIAPDWTQVANKPATFAPSAHASTHLDNGTDAIAVVTSTRTGLAPKLSGNSATYLDGTGLYSTPAGSAAPVMPGALSGLTLLNDSVTPATVLDVNPGGATSDDGTTMMVLSVAAFKKNCNAAWAVGSGNGALDTGASLGVNTWYHVFLIERIDTSVVDVLISTNVSAPTMPTNYTKKRRIGSIQTDASAHIYAFTQLGDQFLWTAPRADASNAGLTSGSLQILGLSIPPGVKTIGLFTASLTAPAGYFMLFQSLDQPSPSGANTPSGNFNLYVPVASQYAAGDFQIRSNTNNQIGIAVNPTVGAGIYVATKGWIDYRGK